MALWKGSFTEDFYNSNLEYSIEENGDFIGTYSPPIQECTSIQFLKERRLGKASLIGKIENYQELIRIRGTWKHQTKNTPFHHTQEGCHFEMLSEKGSSRKCLGCMKGYWWILENEKHPWKWNLKKRSSSTEEVGRFTHRFVISIYMDRFGMMCAWLFFIQSLLQLISFTEEWSCNKHMNLVFNTDYSALYFIFLLAYFELGTNRPHWTYILGVVLYFVGYVCFMFLYADVGDAKALYRGGSWLFLIGSLFLMYATVLNRIQEYNPFSKSSALFWGSSCFLLGSLFFVIDADSYGFGERENVIVGFVLFTIGRIFFVRGSQTPRCDFLFLREKKL